MLLALSLGAFVVACGEGEDERGEPPPERPTQGQRAGGDQPTRTAGGCRRVDQPPPKPAREQPRPKALPRGKRFSLTFETNCGDFTVALDEDAAPKASASLVSLAWRDFFDRTFFHRIVPGFVIQGGDPTGTGQGGPGYSTRDRPPRRARYGKGVVAMAKTGDEPAGTAGSQFFVVTGSDAGLPADYAVVGRVTEGLEVIEKIGAVGDPATERPTEPVVIEDVVVRAS